MYRQLALISLFISIVFGIRTYAESSISLKDMALVRLGGQVYFLSDVQSLGWSLDAISCLGEESYIQKFLSSTSKDSKPIIPSKWSKHSQVEGLDKQLEVFILLEKLKLSSVSSSSSVTSSLSNQDMKKLSKNCSNENWEKMGHLEKSLFVSEIYLRQRFSTSKNLESSMIS